ncbi:MAG: hypothetical protein QIT33_gp12 [Methanophagales virus PBV300]|uniref:Uncharacterized protein n=1 Tax=Methanophagales virus PBV300 TaxID=2987731 RepID=A0ABY6GM01_9VIRU|nr:MAG: hypothetical protein QIT33_gp12 [Methanophagales virus PBV300]UYL64974.1 MAG: hypothetical protein JBCDKDKM_00012 [Methanophagales virus PBV300]
MRVLIIAFEGIDHELARGFHSPSFHDFPHLWQRYQGRIKSDVRTWEDTQKVWASFLTGIPMRRVGEVLVSMKDVGGEDRFILSSLKGSIFSYASRPVCLNMPCVNPHSRYFSGEVSRLEANAARVGKQWKSEFYEECWQFYDEEFALLLNALKTDWDLLIAHFNNPAMVMRVFACEPRWVKRIMLHIDRSLAQLWDKVGDDVLRIVVSPFSVKCKSRRGVLSGEGFFSTNMPVITHEVLKVHEFHRVLAKIMRVHVF